MVSTRTLSCSSMVLPASLVVLLIFHWLLSPALADFRDEVLADAPFLYYEFNETSGFTAIDSSGNGNDGEYIDGVTLGISAPSGGGVTLDGMSGFVESPPTGVVSGTWTIEMIVRADTMADDCCTSLFSTLDYPEVPDNGAGVGGALHFNLEEDGFLFVIDAPEVGLIEEDFEFPVGTGEFAHVVATADTMDALTMQIYVNGELAAETFDLDVGGMTSFDGLGHIAAWDDGRFLGGVLDEFALYDKVLSEDDILRHFTSTTLSPAASLTIDQDTGGVILENISGGELTINSYEISSAAGVLDPTNWASIDGRDSGGDASVDPANDWTITSSTNSLLAEGTDAGAGITLADGGVIDLGDGVWMPFFGRDVAFTGLDGAGEGFFALVGYKGDDVLFADLDLDGDVDPDDWDQFTAGYGSDLAGLSAYDAYFQADLDGDGEHTSDDFIDFVIAFDDFNGEGAFASIVGESVPEPSTVVLVSMCAVVSLLHRRFRLRWHGVAAALVTVMIFTVTSPPAEADLLVEYTFEGNFQDSSGNGRTGVPVGLLGGEPIVLNGQADFSGIPLSYLEVPLGVANPFDGSGDFTIELTFNSLGAEFLGGGVILLGSADSAAPTEPDNHSMSVFIEPHEEEDGDVFGGSLIYDNFFVGEVRVDDALLLDGEDHTIRIAYVAPEETGEPGRMFINLDDEWVVRDEIAPNVPNIANHTVTLGSTLNEDFPFECEEGECFTQEFVGAMDNVRIFDDAQAPTELRAVVDRGTGEISLLGGEFAEEIRFYEIRSEAASLNPAGWNSLSDQDVDSEGGNSGESWDELAAAADRLAEGFLLGASFFDDGRNVSLGNGYNTSVDGQDLEIEVVNADLDSLLLAVEYTGEPPTGVVGDYNDNGTVEQADLDLVLLNWGAAFDTLPAEWVNERPTDGIVDQAELDGVLLNWGDTVAGLGGAGVPEPTSWTLGLVSAIVIGARRLRRRSQA